MIYVFDTSSFIVLKHYYPSSFPTLWSRVDALIADGTIVSVREVLNELHGYNEPDFIQDWAKQHKICFPTPSNAELLIVQQILAVPHFQTVISDKSLLKGTPVADPFVVASAVVQSATVITEEAVKPNAAKIPNLCDHVKTACHNLEWFMAEQGWEF